MTRKQRRGVLIGGAVAVLAVASLLVLFALRDTVVFFRTPSDVAEQAIRFVVIDRHVTHGTRGANGRRANERLWTVIATCALQGRSAFAFILQAVEADFHGQPPPSLLPLPP